MTSQLHSLSTSAFFLTSDFLSSVFRPLTQTRVRDSCPFFRLHQPSILRTRTRSRARPLQPLNPDPHDSRHLDAGGDKYSVYCIYQCGSIARYLLRLGISARPSAKVHWGRNRRYVSGALTRAPRRDWQIPTGKEIPGHPKKTCSYLRIKVSTLRPRSLLPARIFHNRDKKRTSVDCDWTCNDLIALEFNEGGLRCDGYL